MQNTLIPASFLSAALSKDKNIFKSENGTYLIREATADRVSRLYLLFFGSITQTSKQKENQIVPAEPDYYSSYE